MFVNLLVKLIGIEKLVIEHCDAFKAVVSTLKSLIHPLNVRFKYKIQRASKKYLSYLPVFCRFHALAKCKKFCL